ncbi:ion channel [Leucobacter chromiireducens]|uniref:ion channel n=1 Tax=Leucobacter chromiireducens TaxID=283877 RepID=UPI003F7DD25E
MRRPRANPQDPTRPAGRVGRDAMATMGIVFALLIFFATVPLSAQDGTAWWLITLAVGSSLLLAAVLVRMFMRGSNLFRLLALLLVVAVACALGIFTVAREMPGQFSGIETRIDALYFTLTTMTTTGYGDIHAVGQFARALVSLILVFDLVFLGLFGAELSRIAQRTLGRVQGAAADQGHVNPPETAPERQKSEGPEHERTQAE